MRIVSLLASATEIVCALDEGGSLVGRSHECDNPPWVRSLPACSEPAFDISVSSRHAELTLADDGDYILRDVGSTNGTMLNGRDIVPQEEHKLQDGDKVVFGKIEASYVLSLIHI